LNLIKRTPLQPQKHWSQKNDIVANFEAIQMGALQDRNELSAYTQPLHHTIFEKERELLVATEMVYRFYDFYLCYCQSDNDCYKDSLRIAQRLYDWHPVTIEPLTDDEHSAMLQEFTKISMGTFDWDLMAARDNPDEFNRILGEVLQAIENKKLEVARLMHQRQTLNYFEEREGV
jgi:hypothetical protein